MIDTLEVGAVNEVDESYKATITGVKRGGGGDYNGNKIEVWVHDTMEVFWHHFTFSANLAGFRSDAPEGTPLIKEDTRTGKDDSRALCSLMDIESDYIFEISNYGDLNQKDDSGYIIPDYNLDPDLFIGKEVGVVIGDYYGGRRIKAFIPVSDLSTMPVPD
jgi:hypothetical protein